MNYQQTLTRLKKEKKELEESVGTDVYGEDDSASEKIEKQRLKLVKKLIKGYSQSFAGEISGDKIKQVFDTVYGFEKQKEEVRGVLLLQKYFSAKGVKDPQSGKNLCFVGPPGTGKTLFSEKLAEALGRKFHKISLGGASDPSIIRGIRMSILGSEEGEIIKAITETESRDPVILLDEVDKTGSFFGGSVESALLHVLDPSQNQSFKDQFLGVEIDISFATFLLTANDITKIPEPLKNRLEIVKLSAYNREEKFKIGKLNIKNIFSKNYQNQNKDLFEITDAALYTLIDKIDEEGVRQLEKKLGDLIRWAFSQWALALERGEEEKKIIIDEEKVNELVEDQKKEEPKESSEDKLKKENEELNEEIENLKSANLSLSKSLTISNDKGFCDKHNKTTCQNFEGSCALCELEELVKTIKAVITKENLSVLEKTWKISKQKWLEKSNELQDKKTEGEENEAEKELAEKIRDSVAEINQKFNQVRSKSRKANSESNKGFGAATSLLMIGGGIGLFLIGGLVSWFLVKEQKKKKNTEVWPKIGHWKPTTPAPPTNLKK